MNRFDKRKQKIIYTIANADNPVTGKLLSISLDISLRTVQSEIALINKEINLIKSSNRGYTIVADNYHILEKGIVPESSSNEHQILKTLVFASKPQQIDELAEALYMSTSTLQSKLKSFYPVLQQYQLKIQRQNGYIQITGSELDKRRFIKYLLFEEINPGFNSVDSLSLYFQGIDLEKIKSIIVNSINRYNYYIDNAYYNNIIINIVIALYRMRENHYVASVAMPKSKTETDEYKIASEICRQYASHCHITPTDFDVFHIATVLEGQLRLLGKESEVLQKQEVVSPDFIFEIDKILMDVFNNYMLNINYSDYLYNFALHIDGVIKRAQNIQQVNSRISENIKKTCPFVHDVSVAVAQKINEKYHVTIADSEIGYIGIHLGYLIETAAKNTNKVSVLLFCDNYHHIDDILFGKLTENFSDLIDLKLFRAENDSSIISVPSDLIVTTKTLNIIGRRVLTISPFYTMMDHLNIDNAIHKCIDEKEKNYHNNLLSSFFHEKLFFKSDDLRCEEDVIRFLGQKTIDFGLTQEGFIESVLQRERLSSTCFSDTFAIPHAIDMNARKTMVCVLISNKGIQWGEQLCHIVLMITVRQSDRKKFMELYNGIIQILMKPEKAHQLIAANTHVEFINNLITLG